MDSKTSKKLKGAAAHIEKQEDFFWVRSRRSDAAFRIAKIHISSKSDPYSMGALNYGGIIIYGYGGEEERPEVDGTQDRNGRVVIMRTDTEAFEEQREKWRGEPGQVHGIIYRKAFGVSCNGINVVGEGFSIMSGEFMTISGVFNPSPDGFHDESWEMHSVSAECVKKVVEKWKRAGSNFKAQSYSVKSLLSPDNN